MPVWKYGPIWLLWATYWKQVMPGGASETQVTECRRAFYAGALAMFDMLTQGGSTEEEFDEEAGAKVMEAIQKECESYVKAAKRGMI